LGRIPEIIRRQLMRVVVIGGSRHVGTFLVPRLAELGEVEAEWTSKTSR
jgi:hypothetical protein